MRHRLLHRKAATIVAIEHNTKRLQVVDPGGGLVRKSMRDFRQDQPAAGGDHVCGVSVWIITLRDRSRDAALRPGAGRVVIQRHCRNQRDRLRGQLQRTEQSGKASPDDHHTIAAIDQIISSVHVGFRLNFFARPSRLGFI
jgi:hypothetical protein